MSPLKRRDPKKPKDIGIDQFKRQGVGRSVNPNSAAAQLNRQMADKRTQSWLRQDPPVEKLQSKATGKDKARVATEDQNEATLSVEAVAHYDQVGSGSGFASDVHCHATVDDLATEQDGVARVPLRKPNRLTPVSAHRVKVSAGIWGQRSVKVAKEAAFKAAEAAYLTDAMAISMVDSELVANVDPAAIQPAAHQPATNQPVVRRHIILHPRTSAFHKSAPQPFTPRSTSTTTATRKTTPKPAIKPQVPKKKEPQTPMFSDSEGSNLFVTPESGTSPTKNPLHRNNTDMTPILRDKARPLRLNAQNKEIVALASPTNSEESSETEFCVVSPQRSVEGFEKTQASTVKNIANTNTFPVSNINQTATNIRKNSTHPPNPTHLNETFILPPSNKSLIPIPQQRIKKSIAAPMTPKRARSSSVNAHPLDYTPTLLKTRKDSVNDSCKDSSNNRSKRKDSTLAHDDSDSLSSNKKARLADADKVSKPAPQLRKKGVASKPVVRRGMWV